MPRILLCRRPLPRLEQGLEPSRAERDVMVRAYTLVAPVLRRALPTANARHLQGSNRSEVSQCFAVGG